MKHGRNRVRKESAREARTASGIDYDLNANKNQASAESAQRITRNGDGMTGQLFLQIPTNPGSAARLIDVTGRIDRSGDGMTGQLFLQPPTGPGAAARLLDVQNLDNVTVKISGGFMNGALGGPPPTAPGHYARKAETDTALSAANTAQSAATNANNNANTRIKNAAGAVTPAMLAAGIPASKLADRTLGGIKMIVGTVGQTELNANTRDEAMTVSSMRTLVYGSAVSAAGSNHVHVASVNFKSDYSIEEKKRSVELRRRARDGKGKDLAGDMAALKELVLDLAHQLMDDPEESADVWVPKLETVPEFLHEFRMKWEPLYFLRYKLETDPYYREVHGVPDDAPEESIERVLQKVREKNERGHVHEEYDRRAWRKKGAV